VQVLKLTWGKAVVYRPQCCRVPCIHHGYSTQCLWGWRHVSSWRNGLLFLRVSSNTFGEPLVAATNPVVFEILSPQLQFRSALCDKVYLLGLSRWTGRVFNTNPCRFHALSHRQCGGGHVGCCLAGHNAGLLDRGCAIGVLANDRRLMSILYRHADHVVG